MELLSVPLESAHIALGARMVPFGGWNMPVQYGEGILAEHEHTRRQVSIFDCSHMGQFRVRGSAAAAALDGLLPRPVLDQAPGTCRYNFLLAEDGGVLDDLIVYRLSAEEFYLVVNASTIAKDAAWIRAHLPPACSFADESAATAKLDIQGPLAVDFLAGLGLDRARLPRYYRFTQAEVCGVPCLLSRTGYTGERGFELYFAAERARPLWDRLLAQAPLKPAGLGARDTLRLEMGYPLYGHELNEATTPVEAGFGGLVRYDREFIGRAALRRAPRKELYGIRFAGRRAAREGTEWSTPQGQVLGKVSSGSFAPSLGSAVAMAYGPPGAVTAGTAVVAGTGRSPIEGVVQALPFYVRGTARS